MSLHQEIKERTSECHHKLEKDLNLLRPDFSLAEYIEILKKFYGFYLPLEKRMGIEPVKTKWLEKDLNHFKVNKSEISLCENLPPHSTKSHQLGVRYVMEGSTLGGAFLSKHYKDKFDINPENGSCFFSGYQTETGSHWKAFLEELQAFSESKDCVKEDVIVSAMSTFMALSDWLISK